MSINSPRYLQDTNMLEPVPFTIDRMATTTPKKPFISIPLDERDLGKGYRDISFGNFAQAVNRSSWWLKRELGQSQSFETLSYCGPQDLRYQILLLASVKTGYNVGSTSKDDAVASRAKNLVRFYFAILSKRLKTIFRSWRSQNVAYFCTLQILCR